MNTWKAIAQERGKHIHGRYLITSTDEWLLRKFLGSIQKIYPEYSVCWASTLGEFSDSVSRDEGFTGNSRITIMDLDKEDALVLGDLVQIAPEGDIIILIARGKLSKAKAMSHLVAMTISVTTEKPKPWEIGEWLHNIMTTSGFSLTKETAELIVERSGPELSSIASEVEKLQLYRPSKKISLDDVEAVVPDANSEVNYQIVSAMLMGQSTKVLIHIANIPEKSFIGIIQYTLKELEVCYYSSVLRSAGKTPEYIADRVGIKAWTLRNKYLRSATLLGKGRIIRMRQAMINTERMLKSSNWASRQIAEYGFMRAMRG